MSDDDGMGKFAAWSPANWLRSFGFYILRIVRLNKWGASTTTRVAAMSIC
jgi:hypothetical protein